MVKDDKPGGYFANSMNPEFVAASWESFVQILCARFVVDDVQSGVETWERRVRECEALTKYDVPDFIKCDVRSGVETLERLVRECETQTKYDVPNLIKCGEGLLAGIQ
eukprot:3868559-Amphidinium_carterae.1